MAVAQDDFVKDLDDLFGALDEEHGHGIDVEIERPDEGIGGIEGDEAEVEGGVEGVVDAMAARADEFGRVLLTVGIGIEFAGGAEEFGIRDPAAIGGGELEGLPVGIVLGVREVFVEVIAAFGRADEEGAAFAVTEGGTKDFGPGCGFHGREFVEDEEIEADAAERVGLEGTVDDERGAVREMNAEFAFAGAFQPVRTRHFFEALPGDAFGLTIVRADVPDEAIGGGEGVEEHFGEGEIGFAETAAGDDDAKTSG